jgi:hypothetical protein
MTVAVCPICRSRSVANERALRAFKQQRAAPEMAALLDRIDDATTAGARADDVEIAVALDEWRAVKRRHGLD